MSLIVIVKEGSEDERLKSRMMAAIPVTPEKMLLRQIRQMQEVTA